MIADIFDLIRTIEKMQDSEVGTAILVLSCFIAFIFFIIFLSYIGEVLKLSLERKQIKNQKLQEELRVKNNEQTSD